MPKPTISTEDYSHDEEDGTNTYGGDTYTLATATAAFPGEVAVTGLISSLRDVFKCVMHVVDPQCSAANLMPPRGDARPSGDMSDDDDACGPPANISIPPAPRGINNRARQNQFKRKSLVEDMKSLVRVRLRKPLGIIFTSIRNDLKGVCIYDLPEDGKAYRKVKTSLSVGDVPCAEATSIVKHSIDVGCADAITSSRRGSNAPETIAPAMSGDTWN